MAEYKYRALGWKDDDIASLNVVDSAADNQVELQITKQGGGTIDGPAIVGKDGIIIDKAADSEKIEISGSGCVQSYTHYNDAQVYMVRPDAASHTMQNGITRLATYSGAAVKGTIPVYFDSNVPQNIPEGVLITGIPTQESNATNKKYVDDNYVKKVKFTNLEQALYGYILDTTKEAYADLDSAV